MRVSSLFSWRRRLSFGWIEVHKHLKIWYQNFILVSYWYLLVKSPRLAVKSFWLDCWVVFSPYSVLLLFWLPPSSIDIFLEYWLPLQNAYSCYYWTYLRDTQHTWVTTLGVISRCIWRGDLLINFIWFFWFERWGFVTIDVPWLLL